MKRFVLFIFLVVCVQKVTLQLDGHHDRHIVVTNPYKDPVTINETFDLNIKDGHGHEAWTVTKVEATCKTFRESKVPTKEPKKK